ncbi:MAG TPA: GNAT family N-acetyltransferase [Pseudonocardiaceae bacterium]|nr:GNAT family N-acetyltransferase [Pseudonocardiaceae bacterium]
MELRAIQSCLRAGIRSRAAAVGPFLALLNTTSDSPFLNYAVPVDNSAPNPADVAELVAFFTGHDRQPRLEYVRPAPRVDEPLLAAGFDVTPTLTLMALGEFTPVGDVPGYRVHPTEDGAELRQAVAVQNTAYGEPDPTNDVLGLPGIVRAGGCVAVAVDPSGDVVGSGLWPSPKEGLVEVLGIGVLPAHRGRGLARSLASVLTDAALRQGDQPFLQVADDEPERIYERLGYRVIGAMADARLTVR